MDLKYHYTAAHGFTQLVTPGLQPLKDLNFGMLRLDAGETYAATSADDEVGCVLLAGTANVRVDMTTYADLGGRASVFDDRATAVYVPIQTDFAITAGASGVEVAICRSHATQVLPVQVIRPADVVVRDVGGVGFQRYVHDILGATNAQAQGMLIGETFTPAGNWSSFPPHKHDTLALPDEVQQEELYLYRIRPDNGFGIQCWYTRADSPFEALDASAVVRANDVTIMPYGYHPVAAPPGYDVYYLWFMAGPVREMHPNDDPDHAWIKTAPATPRSYPQ